MDFARASGLTLAEAGTFVVDRYSLETSRPKFYAGGDVITGASNVSNAMGYGKKAARKIDETLMGAKRFHSLFGGFEYSQAPRRTSQSESPAPIGRAGAGAARAERPGSGARPDAGRGARRSVPLPAVRRERVTAMIQKSKAISIRIEGELVPTREGKTILQAAREAGKSIPTLCHMDGLNDVGACRLCIVEIGGSGRLAPACTTPVQEGLSVVINSPRLAAYRRMILELLLAERNHICAVCVANGHCELQSLAASLGVTSVRFRYRYPAHGRWTSRRRGTSSTTIAAFSARAAYAFAPKWKARTSGTSWGAASTRG